MDFLKAEQLSNSKWRVLAIPFGGPFKGGKDLDGEFFSKNTDIKPDWFKERPVMWQHGQDDRLKDSVLGTEDDLTQEDDGWWATMWLDRSNRYWAQVNELLAAGKAYGSSGALGHIVQKDHKTGEILVWPHIEQTLTVTPSNPFARVVSAKAAAHFTSAGIPTEVLGNLPDLGTTAELGHELPSGGDGSAKRRLLGIANVQLARIKTL